ncbi:MAG: response regulator [Cyclobacteriaceae bacterium]|nr:response regulator [Cyclobacteriaceae bacterium]
MNEKTKILVVDDSLFQRRVIGDILRENNYEVLQASNGREGIKLFESDHPTLILLDLLMPDMNGIEVIKEIKKRSGSQKIIVLSADIQQAIKDECADLGVFKFLNKPAKEKELLEVISAALNE